MLVRLLFFTKAAANMSAFGGINTVPNMLVKVVKQWIMPALTPFTTHDKMQ